MQNDAINNMPMQQRASTLGRGKVAKAMISVILGLALSAPALADYASKATDKESKARYEAAVEQAEADYKAAKAKCDELKGNDKDVCMKEAKAAEKKAKADAKAMKKSSKAESAAMEEKREADYKTAKERCDELSGDAKDACEAEAKMKYKQ
jgi:hypothetical protein